MITKSQKIRLGIFSVVAVSILIITLFLLSVDQFIEDQDIYYIAYEDVSVGGLDVGSPVKYLGLKVGSVKKIKIDPNNINRIIVQIGLTEGTPIKKDVEAEISTIGITGLKIIELRGGTNEAEILKPGRYINAGQSFTEAITGKAEVIAEKIEQALNNLIAFTSSENQEKFSEAFGNALRKEIRITIVTPDKGDVPLWMNTQVGSVLSQFKKFGMAATQAVLMRGLQERDQNFFTGVLFLVGMGAMVDMIRTKAFDRDYSKKKLGDKIASAIDRSAVIGIFSDVNRMIEVMSNNDMGIAPMLGAGKPYDSTFRQKMGLAGPTGSLLSNLHEIMIDTGSGNYDYTTARAIRRSLPLQNIWYLDGIFDRFEKSIR
jgi:hypothetical protein